MLFPKSIRLSPAQYTRLLPTLVKQFFIGFISGNIFGSFISLLIFTKGSAILTIAGVILLLETIYKFCFTVRGELIPYVKKQNLALVFGVLMGFFIDAYKVGS